MRTWIIRFANASLFTLCCWLTAGVVTSVAGEVLLPARAAIAPREVAQPAARKTWRDREQILRRNLFGAQLAAEVIPIVTNEPLVDTKLPLKLLGTIAGETDQVSNAAIEDMGTRKHQVVFIGDALDAHPGVTVERIERKRVVINNNGKREELALEGGATASPRQRAARKQPNRTASRTRPSRRSRAKPNPAAELENLRNQGVQQSLASLYQARPVLKYEDEEVVGVTFNNVKKGDLLDQIGVKQGDVITSLNDIPIDDRAATGKLLTELSGANSITIQLLDGQTISLDATQVANLRTQAGQ